MSDFNLYKAYWFDSNNFKQFSKIVAIEQFTNNNFANNLPTIIVEPITTQNDFYDLHYES